MSKTIKKLPVDVLLKRNAGGYWLPYFEVDGSGFGDCSLCLDALSNLWHLPEPLPEKMWLHISEGYLDEGYYVTAWRCGLQGSERQFGSMVWIDALWLDAKDLTQVVRHRRLSEAFRVITDKFETAHLYVSLQYEEQP